jgi:hypothetical protein
MMENVYNKLYGVANGLSYGQFERTDELNSRISARHFSDTPLAPNFNARPASTRYATMPIIDKRAPSIVPIKNIKEHSVTSNFNPGNNMGPPETFFSNIDTESSLRNITTSNQPSAQQSIYVPSSTSDLYMVSVPSNGRIPTHPGLFQQFSHSTLRSEIPLSMAVGKNTFFNNTRSQLRNM